MPHSSCLARKASVMQVSPFRLAFINQLVVAMSFHFVMFYVRHLSLDLLFLKIYLWY